MILPPKSNLDQYDKLMIFVLVRLQNSTCYIKEYPKTQKLDQLIMFETFSIVGSMI